MLRSLLRWLYLGLTCCLFGSIALPVQAQQLDLSEYKGKVVLLDFWAAWCEPCRDSFPWMDKMAARYPDDLVVIAINLDHDRVAATKFLATTKPAFHIIYDPKSAISEAYGVVGLPYSILYDRQGRRAGQHNGFQVDQIPKYEATLKRLIDHAYTP